MVVCSPTTEQRLLSQEIGFCYFPTLSTSILAFGQPCLIAIVINGCGDFPTDKLCTVPFLSLKFCVCCFAFAFVHRSRVFAVRAETDLIFQVVYFVAEHWLNGFTKVHY
jgi:hypothetical protein